MDQSTAVKWSTMIAFLFIMWNVNYKSTTASLRTKNTLFRDIGVNRKMTVKLSEPTNVTYLNKHNASDLNFEDYRSSDGCDFSEFVRQFKPEQLDINCDNIHEVKVGKLLGAGALRQVYEGEWHGKKVALKMVKHNTKNHVQKITQAAAVLFQLRESSNIVKMIGWCDTTIILEKATGTLDEIIKEQKISVERALEMSFDIMKGLQQLHALPGGPVVHNDLKKTQFLVNERGNLLLSDLDKMRYSGYSDTNKKCYYYWKDSPLDEQNDIKIVATILQTLSQKSESETSRYPQAMKDLVVEALGTDPTKIPNSTEMVQRIGAILRNYRTSTDYSLDPFTVQ